MGSLGDDYPYGLKEVHQTRGGGFWGFLLILCILAIVGTVLLNV